jgi:hypothetical protein
MARKSHAKGSEEIKARQRRDLPMGMVKAIKGLRHRVPPDTHEALAAVADRSFERLVEAMEGKVSFRQVPSVIKAATALREEICGPMPKEVKVSGTMTLEALVARAAEQAHGEQG